MSFLTLHIKAWLPSALTRALGFAVVILLGLPP
jgi:hypothetical protein